MKLKVKDIIIALAVIMGIAVFFTVVINTITPYLFKPAEAIKRDLLRTTPIGMDIDDVFEVLKNDKKHKNWSVPMNNYVPKRGDTQIKGLHYGLPPYIGVSWMFDEDGKLIDIYVRKYWTP